MNSIKLNFVENKDLKIYSSKYLGCPSIPKYWLNKDMFKENDIFICQINLEDLVEYNIPINKTGILYFFINVEEKKCKVFYEITKDLVEVEFNDSSFDENLSKEYKINFENNNNYYLDGSKLFGIPANNEKFNKFEDVLLLQIDTLQDDNVFLSNEDLIFQFIIKKEDLTKKNFSNVELEIIKL